MAQRSYPLAELPQQVSGDSGYKPAMSPSPDASLPAGLTLWSVPLPVVAQSAIL